MLKEILEALKSMSWPGVAAIFVICATVIALAFAFGGAVPTWWANPPAAIR